jgi:hypothetical protein
MQMQSHELDHWFAATKQLLEPAYVVGELPWQQSGFGLRSPRTYEEWEALRMPLPTQSTRRELFSMSAALMGFCCNASSVGQNSVASM